MHDINKQQIRALAASLEGQAKGDVQLAARYAARGETYVEKVYLQRAELRQQQAVAARSLPELPLRNILL